MVAAVGSMIKLKVEAISNKGQCGQLCVPSQCWLVASEQKSTYLCKVSGAQQRYTRRTWHQLASHFRESRIRFLSSSDQCGNQCILLVSQRIQETVLSSGMSVPSFLAMKPSNYSAFLPRVVSYMYFLDLQRLTRQTLHLTSHTRVLIYLYMSLEHPS